MAFAQSLTTETDPKMSVCKVRGDVTTVSVCCKPCPEPCPVQHQFQALQPMLTALGLPLTLDRRHTPRDGGRRHVTVVILSETEEGANVFLEGNRQCSDGFLLALDSNWLTRSPSPDRPGLDTLHVHQAITADRCGHTYLDCFSPPRRASYLVNHLTGDVTSQRMTGGEELGAFGLDVPCSSSLALNARADDKLLTTAMCAVAGVPHPVTLGFRLPGNHPAGGGPQSCSTVTEVRLTSANIDAEHVQSAVRQFLGSRQMEEYEQVVVKPFGTAWNSCKGVTYHLTADVTDVVNAALDLLSRVETGILIQSYHPTFDLVIQPGLGRHAINYDNMDYAFRVRSIVCRTPQNDAKVTQVICGINHSHIPIAGTNTVPSSVELTLQQWGVKDKQQRRDIFSAICRSSEALMVELMQQERQLTPEERGGHGCQTELLGIDFVVTKVKDGRVVPVVIEVNAQDCLYQVTVYETMHRRQRGYAARTYVQTMLARSQEFLMAGRTVLVIGAGGFSKLGIWKDARRLGIKIILVDSNPDHPARRDVEEFLHVDMTDHTQDATHAAIIVSLLDDRLPGLKLDGCLTFWEDAVPLAALVCESLGLTHAPSYRAALTAKSKMLTQNELWAQTREPPHTPPTSLYASPAFKVDSPGQVLGILQQIPLPVVMKPEFGSSAVGVKAVDTVREALQHAQFVKQVLREEASCPGVGLGHGNGVVVTPRLLGTEHDVDLVLFEGSLVAAFLSDNGPTRLPFCAELTAAMPSVLRKEHQRQLISAAMSCCLDLGLTTGVFNVEMMLTARGPRLIEVNARMGGFYLRHWIRIVYQADLLLMACMCACGIRPVHTGITGWDEDEDDDLDYGYGFNKCRSSVDDDDEIAGHRSSRTSGEVSLWDDDDETNEKVVVGVKAAYNGIGGRIITVNDIQKGVRSLGKEKEISVSSLCGTRHAASDKRTRDNKDDVVLSDLTTNGGGFPSLQGGTGRKPGGRPRMMGIMLYPSRHGKVLSSPATLKRLGRMHDDGDVVFVQLEETPEDRSEGKVEDPVFGNLGVVGVSVEDARSRLTAACVALNLETEESLREMLQDFVTFD